MSTILGASRDSHELHRRLREKLASLEQQTREIPGTEPARRYVRRHEAAAGPDSRLGELSEIFALARLISSVPITHVRLAVFVGFLRAHEILPATQEYSSEQQDILQKCAFIAQRGFGLRLGYEYHLHEYGTFSSFLAADYHELVGMGVHSGATLMQPQFDSRAFLSLVSGRGIEWLSLASTVFHERGSCPDGSLMEHVAGISADYDDRLAGEVMSAIRSNPPSARGAAA